VAGDIIATNGETWASRPGRQSCIVRPLIAALGTLLAASYGHAVNALYVIAVMTSLNCGLDVLCLRAVEPDATGEHAQMYSTPNDCIVALKRLTKTQHDAAHELDLRCVPDRSALPYMPPKSK
jgi:hypothetical protein